jgi:hypothetical protein
VRAISVPVGIILLATLSACGSARLGASSPARSQKAALVTAAGTTSTSGAVIPVGPVSFVVPDGWLLRQTNATQFQTGRPEVTAQLAPAAGAPTEEAADQLPFITFDVVTMPTAADASTEFARVAREPGATLQTVGTTAVARIDVPNNDQTWNSYVFISGSNVVTVNGLRADSAVLNAIITSAS